jgi:hypothetical protein
MRAQGKRAIVMILVALIGMALLLGSCERLFNRFDQAVEIDDLKDQIRVQRTEIQFFLNFLNGAFADCKFTVSDFTRYVEKSGDVTVHWRGDKGTFSWYEVTKKGECIQSIKVMGYL